MYSLMTWQPFQPHVAFPCCFLLVFSVDEQVKQKRDKYTFPREATARCAQGKTEEALFTTSTRTVKTIWFGIKAASPLLVRMMMKSAGPSLGGLLFITFHPSRCQNRGSLVDQACGSDSDT